MVRAVMPCTVPLALVLRQAPGTVPEKKLRLPSNRRSAPRSDQPAGSVPVSVLLPSVRFFISVAEPHPAGRVPALRTQQSPSDASQR